MIAKLFFVAVHCALHSRIIFLLWYPRSFAGQFYKWYGIDNIWICVPIFVVLMAECCPLFFLVVSWLTGKLDSHLCVNYLLDKFLKKLIWSLYYDSLGFVEKIVACSIKNSLLCMLTWTSGHDVENIHSDLVEFFLCLQANIQNNVSVA